MEAAPFTTQLIEPEFGTPEASVSNGADGPARPSSTSTAVTPTLSVAVQVTLTAWPTVQLLPPFGDSTVTTGGWDSTNRAVMLRFAIIGSGSGFEVAAVSPLQPANR